MDYRNKYFDLTNYIAQSLFEKLIDTQSRNSLPYMEREGSLLCSQQPTAGPYPEPDESSPHLPTLFPKGPF